MAEPDFLVSLLLQVFPDGIAFKREFAVPDQHLTIALTGHAIFPLSPEQRLAITALA
jgi:hypothetical protein